MLEQTCKQHQRDVLGSRGEQQRWTRVSRCWSVGEPRVNHCEWPTKVVRDATGSRPAVDSTILSMAARTWRNAHVQIVSVNEWLSARQHGNRTKSMIVSQGVRVASVDEWVGEWGQLERTNYWWNTPARNSKKLSCNRQRDFYSSFVSLILRKHCNEYRISNHLNGSWIEIKPSRRVVLSVTCHKRTTPCVILYDKSPLFNLLNICGAVFLNDFEAMHTNMN